jgi:hypothetical protein
MSRGHEILVVTASPPDIDARHATGPDFVEYEYEGVKVHSIGEALRLRGYTFRHEYDLLWLLLPLETCKHYRQFEVPSCRGLIE